MACRAPRKATFLTFVLLILFGCASFLWVRSYHHMEGFQWSAARSSAVIYSRDGSVRIGLLTGDDIPNHLRGGASYPGIGPGIEIDWWAAAMGNPRTRMGFMAEVTTDSLGPEGSMRVWRLYALPYWFLCLALIIIPARYCLRLWSTRSREGHLPCRNCGYDLRASPERCPECGVVVSPRK
jgi:hypothetical protein